MSTTVRLLVEVTDDKPVHEEVHVEDRGAGTYRVLQSPGFVGGLAAEDVFLLEANGAVKLLQRGENIAIQRSLPSFQRFDGIMGTSTTPSMT